MGWKRSWVNPWLGPASAGMEDCGAAPLISKRSLAGTKGRATWRQQRWSLGRVALLGVLQPAPRKEDMDASPVLAHLPLAPDRRAQLKCLKLVAWRKNEENDGKGQLGMTFVTRGWLKGGKRRFLVLLRSLPQL